MVETLLTGIQTSLTGEIASALPIAGVIMASVAGIFMGVKIFKGVTGART